MSVKLGRKTTMTIQAHVSAFEVLPVSNLEERSIDFGGQENVSIDTHVNNRLLTKYPTKLS